MECALGTIGLLALAGTTFMTSLVALALVVLPQILERRRIHLRAAFLRTQLLHQLNSIPQFLQERNRHLALEDRDILDEWCCLAQQAVLLEMEEWTSVLRTQALLMIARNRPSFTKRESRIAQQSIDQTASVLQTYASDRTRPGVWWHGWFSNGTGPTPHLRPVMDQSFKFRNTVG